jgi:hypothetical protein
MTPAAVKRSGVSPAWENQFLRVVRDTIDQTSGLEQIGLAGLVSEARADAN